MALVDRAREHIDEARSKINAFFERRPYALVVDVDRDTGQEVHKIRLTAKIPGSLIAIVKDATSNLRDALDHAVYASAVRLAGGGDPDNTGFPFARDAAGVAGELNGRRLRGNPPEIRPYLASLEPHETGNPILWALNRARNPNTHRILVPVGAASTGTSMRIIEIEASGPSMIGMNKWLPATNEVEFMRLGSQGSKVEYEVQATFQVTFGEVDCLRGKEVLGALDAMASEVKRVVLGIKAETARILSERPAK